MGMMVGCLKRNYGKCKRTSERTVVRDENAGCPNVSCIYRAMKVSRTVVQTAKQSQRWQTWRKTVCTKV